VSTQKTASHNVRSSLYKYIVTTIFWKDTGEMQSVVLLACFPKMKVGL